MDFKLDRSAFRATSNEAKGTDFVYWKTKTDAEKLAAAFYLNSVAYNFDINNPPKMDKTVFSMGRI
jgi:hypothetical protein